MLTGDMMAANQLSGPTLFYPPPPSTEYFPATGARCVSYSPSPEPQSFARPPPTQQRSRKRSRDQAEDDDREAAFQVANTMDTTEPEPEAVFGEGMVLINPLTGQPVGSGASSSTGTWCEEKVEEERLAVAAAEEQQKRNQEEMARAASRPSKAQRIDLAGIQGSGSGSPSTTPGMVAPAPITPATPMSPVYDEAAMMLGIGWRKVEGSEDVALTGASKGWARYIDNHFANLSNPQILAKSAGKEVFLVKAFDGNFGAEGFYLFSDSLDQGQLLGCDEQTAIANLRSGSFVGQLMNARRSASPEPFQLPTPAAEVTMEM